MILWYYYFLLIFFLLTPGTVQIATLSETLGEPEVEHLTNLLNH
jgi:hypothetical protein